ncbi:MAG: hypothetical protein AAGK23_00505 [Pseudomonadota bacterium]
MKATRNLVTEVVVRDAPQRAPFVNEIGHGVAPVQAVTNRPHILSRRAARWARRASY